MSVDLELYLRTTFTLFIIIDPIGYSLLFFSLTKDYEKKIRFQIAYRAFIFSAFILSFYLIFGNLLLGLIHVDIGAMKITGGLSLFKTAYTIIYEKKNEYTLLEGGEEDALKLAIYPLSTGLLAGPGTLTTIIILSHEFEEMNEYLTMFLGILTILFLSFLGSLVTKYLNMVNKNILDLLNITIGILLSSLSVTFIMNGVKMFF